MFIAYSTASIRGRYLLRVPTLRALEKQFATYNRLFFRGALPDVKIGLYDMSNHYGFWEPPARGQPPGAPYGHIVLSFEPPRRVGWRGILLHEMIHVWLHYTRHEDYPFPEDHAAVHDAAFTRECNRIGRRLGLPEVSEEESWSWPHALFYNAPFDDYPQPLL